MILRVDRKIPGAPGNPFFKALGEKTLRSVKDGPFAGRAEVSLVLCGDAAMRKLNRLWRRIDRPTDVLSFPMGEAAPPQGRSVGPLLLGDVVISVPAARRQAAAAGKTLKDEASLLWVHGLLHLLGYDHTDVREEKRMFALQTRLLGGK